MKEPIINGLKAIDNKAQEMGQENFKLVPQEMQQGAKDQNKEKTDFV